jgi:hypothetical protein
LRKTRGPAPLVIVAANGGDRRDLGQPLQDGRIADVAGVNDEIAAAKRFDRLGPQQPVGIGDQSDAAPGGWLHHVLAIGRGREAGSLRRNSTRTSHKRKTAASLDRHRPGRQISLLADAGDCDSLPRSRETARQTAELGRSRLDPPASG